MDSKTTSTNRRRNLRSGGWTLAEMMVALAIFSVSAAALGSLFLFGVRSFAAAANYTFLDKQNRHAMDVLTKEIRSAQCLTSCSNFVSGGMYATAITILNQDSNYVVFEFDSSSSAGRLIRSESVSGVQRQEVLLDACDLMEFKLYKRVIAGNWDLYAATNKTDDLQRNVKAIQLTWKTSLRIDPTTRTNSENIETAMIVIRK